MKADPWILKNSWYFRIMLKNIAILGSTGSIGVQTLEVISAYPDRFGVEILTAGKNYKLLAEQARKFLPNAVAIAEEKFYPELQKSLEDLPVKVFAGEDAIEQLAGFEEVDMVLTALVGFSGLKPTIEAIKAGKDIALANKETLVVAGQLIIDLARKHQVRILPVDSEHSAIFQCLVGEGFNKIEKIYLTASGGPFRGMDRKALARVTREQALNHPNWNMGAKITIDSASLMNKGFEAIEAKWLFQLKPEQIEVVVHPQSIIHSMVQFEDGSIKAQLGLPDMKLPILYALSFPERLKTDYPRFNFLNFPSLQFEKPDMEVFKNLKLAWEAMKSGGNAPCILNAANETVVQAFLENKIPFLKMPEIIEEVLHKIPYLPDPVLGNYLEADKESRQIAWSIING